MKKAKQQIERRRLESSDSQGQLLYEVIGNHGKVQDIANLIQVDKKRVENWRIKGRVPLHAVGVLARALNEDIYIFNYEEVARLLGDAPSWEDVVKSARLSDIKTEFVLSKPHPKSLEEILEEEHI